MSFSDVTPDPDSNRHNLGYDSLIRTILVMILDITAWSGLYNCPIFRFSLSWSAFHEQTMACDVRNNMMFLMSHILYNRLCLYLAQFICFLKIESEIRSKWSYDIFFPGYNWGSSWFLFASLSHSREHSFRDWRILKQHQFSSPLPSVRCFSTTSS